MCILVVKCYLQTVGGSYKGSTSHSGCDNWGSSPCPPANFYMLKNIQRCPWPSVEDKLYLAYHDKEWGVPVYNDRLIYEFLILETFQAGLSWRTVLYKRKNFEKAFANFDFRKVAKFTSKDEKKLLKDPGIIRNRLKVDAAVVNAQKFLEVRKEYGTFSKYMWSWVKGKPILNKTRTPKDYQTTSEEAVAWAKDLKKRGFKFLGPTVVYAHMQAVGMVNDHMVNCFRYKEVQNTPSNPKIN